VSFEVHGQGKKRKPSLNREIFMGGEIRDIKQNKKKGGGEKRKEKGTKQKIEKRGH